MRLPKFVTILILFFCLLVPAVGLCQIDPGCDPGGNLNCDCPENQGNPACPIDGGLSLLLAAGVGLGARKAYLAKKTAPAQQ